MTAILLSTIDEAISAVPGNQITVGPIVVAIDLTSVSMHRPHHARSLDLDQYATPGDGIALMVNETCFIAHGPHILTLMNSLAVE